MFYFSPRPFYTASVTNTPTMKGDAPPRRRSVRALCERCNWHATHSQQVAALALSIFDQTQPLHRLDAHARELLEYACWLHDIGYAISAKRHHKHGRDLVLSAGLSSFAQVEVQMLAAMVRYHRKRQPQPDDAELQGLNVAQRGRIAILAGILRVADGLDRTQSSIVQCVVISIGQQTIDLRLHTQGPAAAEIHFALEKSDLLADTLNRGLHIEKAEGRMQNTEGRTQKAERSLTLNYNSNSQLGTGTGTPTPNSQLQLQLGTGTGTLCPNSKNIPIPAS